MSRTTDPDLFFQTTWSLSEKSRKSEKSANQEGSPLVLSSKILAIHADPSDDNRVFVAESAATARRVVLDTRNTSHVYRGPEAPLCCLEISPDGTTLLAGSWDKAIWSWDIESRKAGKRFLGHSDFVKTILCVRVASQTSLQGGTPFEDLLISGGADAVIVVWSLGTGQRLHVLKGHARGILDLALQPVALLNEPPEAAVVFSAGSDREIRRWKISAHVAVEVNGSKPILAHETSVSRLRFAVSDGDGIEEAELWTASSDKTAKCLSQALTTRSEKDAQSDVDWHEDTSLPHPDFVRDIVVDMQNNIVITACRDEEIRVWDKATADLIHTYSGHFEEVTGLTLINAPGRRRAISVSIDGTIRSWQVGRNALTQAKENAANLKLLSSPNLDSINKESKKHEGASNSLTEDEERELAELMEDDG